MIRITDEPIATIDDAEELPTGEIGELIVRGPQVSPSMSRAPKQTLEVEDRRSDEHSGIARATLATSTNRVASGTADANHSEWKLATGTLFTE